MKFIDFLNERYLNLFKAEEKEQYKDIVFELVQQSYAYIGGMKGSGFSTADDMVKNIQMWKLAKINGKIVAGELYKDKSGRKTVATFTDGSSAGKKAMADIFRSGMDRSCIEISGQALGFLVKSLDRDYNLIKKYAKTPQEVSKFLKKEVQEPTDDDMIKRFPELVPYMYSRKLASGEIVSKVLLGTSGNVMTGQDFTGLPG